MKRIVSILVLFSLFIAGACFLSATVPQPLRAETPSWSNFVSQPIVALYGKDSIWNGTKFDSVTGTDDTCILKTGFKPETNPGWQYCLYWSAFSGAGASGLVGVIDIICKDYNGNKLYTVTIDTLQTGHGLNGGVDLLPIGTSAVGVYYDLLLRTLAGSSGSKIIINRVGLVRRRLGP